jgi:multiple sugar transport system substrate-binding protein
MGPYSDKTPDSMNTIVANFQNANPGVTVNYQTAPWETYDEKITTAAKAGDGPALAMQYTFGKFITDGFLRPVEEWVSPELLADIYPALLGPGEGYAIPDLASVRGSFLNTALMGTAGVAAPPATLDELTAALKALKAADSKVTPMGFVSTTDDIGPSYSYYLFGVGGEWIDASGKYLLNSPKSVEALTYIKSLYDEGLIEQDVTANRGAQEERFLAGKTAIMPTGNFFVATLKDKAPDLAYQVGPLPHGAGVSPFAVAVTDYFISFKQQTPEQDAAGSALVEFVMTPENYVPWLAGDGFLPVTASAADAFRAAAPEQAPFLDNLGSAKFFPSGDARWAKVVETMSATVQSVLLGREGVQEALDAAQATIDALPAE